MVAGTLTALNSLSRLVAAHRFGAADHVDLGCREKESVGRREFAERTTLTSPPGLWFSPR